MSSYGLKWKQLNEWVLHLQRKKLGGAADASRDTYTEGFNDAVDMIARFMQASEMEPTETGRGENELRYQD